jgi:choice-of-anchor A domain-containing protein
VAIGGSDVEGRVAVKNDVTISNYSVSFELAPPSGAQLYLTPSNVTATTRNDLIACGALRFLSGAVMGGGNVVYLSAASVIQEPIASVYAPGAFVHASECPVDFDDAATRMEQLSLLLASAPRTGTSVMQYTYVTLVYARVTCLTAFLVCVLLTTAAFSLSQTCSPARSLSHPLQCAEARRNAARCERVPSVRPRLPRLD